MTPQYTTSTVFKHAILGKLQPEIHALLNRSRRVSKWHLTISVSMIDEKIGGVGIHSVLWERIVPRMPFAWRYDGIVRPLRYVPFELIGGAHYGHIGRSIIDEVGAHLDECVTETLVDKARYQNSSASSRLKAAETLDHKTKNLISEFYKLFWNPAKHRYKTGRPGSVFSIAEGLEAYFVGRALGVTVLREGNRLRSFTTTMGKARKIGRVYVSPSIGDLRFLEASKKNISITDLIRKPEREFLEDPADYLELHNDYVPDSSSELIL